MRRCLGRTSNLRRCQREGAWRFFCHDHNRQPIIWLFTFIFTVMGGAASIYSVIKSSDKPVLEPVRQTPDVALRFVYPKSPALMLVNQSAVLARDIRWTIVLWNLDLPDRNDPLPIPTGKSDWIRPHDEGGPQDLFNSPLVAPLLKSGNRLFGSASIVCAECARGRTYIVYIVWDDDGWFSEVENEKSGKILIPPNFLKVSRSEYFKALEAVASTQSRTPIGVAAR